MPAIDDDLTDRRNAPSSTHAAWLQAKELEVGRIESRIPQGYEDLSSGLIAEAMYKRGIRYVPDGADH